jgi:hypothetical protein
MYKKTQMTTYNIYIKTHYIPNGHKIGTFTKFLHSKGFKKYQNIQLIEISCCSMNKKKLAFRFKQLSIFGQKIMEHFDEHFIFVIL